MYDYNQCLLKINNEIKDLNFNKPPLLLYEPIEYVLAMGGKRLRPVLVLMACNMYRDDVEHALRPALGLEVFHNFTLMHDDIMDNASLRRNQMTVHKKWNNNVAILSGDAMLIKAYELITENSFDKIHEIIRIFNKTAIEVCEGQQFDMLFEEKNVVGINEYIHMIRLKTSVLIAACLQVGAILGGAENTDADLIYNMGINLGIAFQLQDDYLDSFGDELVFGKKIGGDIVSNKKTILLITAMNKADFQQKKQIEVLLNSKDIPGDEKIQRMLKIYHQLNIQQETQNFIQHYFIDAQTAFEKLHIPSSRKKHMTELFNSLFQREF